MSFKQKTLALMLGGIGLLPTVGFSQKDVAKDGLTPGGLTPEKFIDPANMDTSVKPGDDFYNYASGNWIKNNPVPAKETRWGSFNVLRDFNIAAVRGLLDDAAKSQNAPAGSVERRVSDFYKAAMDSMRIEKMGYAPIKADLQRVSSLKSKNAVLEQIAEARTMGQGSPFFGFYVGQDRKNVEVMVPQFSQGGTTLPDRDYYLKDDARMSKIQSAYADYITQLFTLTGTSAAQAKANAATIIKLETELARAQMPRVEMRDPYKTYNKLSVKDFTQKTPHFDWQKLMPMMMVEGQDTVLVNNPSFFVKADSLFDAASLSDLKAYLEWNVLKSSANYLSSPFVDAAFAFNQVLSGQKVQTPRWQRMSQLTDRDHRRAAGAALRQEVLHARR